MRIQKKLLIAFLVVSLPVFLGGGLILLESYRAQKEQVLQSQRKLAQATASAVEILVSDLTQEALALGRKLGEPGRVEKLPSLLAGFRHNRHIKRVCWIDRDGQLVAVDPSLRLTQKISLADRAYFQELRKGRDWVVSDLLISRAGGDLVWGIGAAVRNREGKFLGVALLLVDPKVFAKLLPEELDVGEDLMILDRNARIVYWSKHPDLPWEARDRIPAMGAPMIATSAPIGSIGWTVRLAIPAALVMGPALRETQLLLWTLAIIGILSISASFLLSRRFGGLLERLTGAAERIAEGDLSQQVEVVGKDELAILASSFNRMAGALASSQEALRERAEELERKTHRLNTLNLMSRLVTSSLDLSRLFEALVRAAAELLQGSVALLWVLEEEVEEVVLRASFGITRWELRERNRLKAGEGLAGWIVQTKEPLLLRDCSEDPRVMCHTWFKAEGLRGFVGVPLLLGERSLGVLSVFRTTTEPFTEEDLDLLNALAAQATIAIEHARLYRTVVTANQEWEGTFDAVPDLIYIHDADYRILRVNRAFAEWAGLPFSQVIGRRCQEVFAGLDLLCLQCPHEEVVTGGGPVPEEVQDPRTGKIYWVTTSPGRDREGKLCCFVHVARDITKIKQAEEQLQAQNRELLALYQQVEQDRMMKATLLKELNHRVRNNLAAIISLLQMELRRASLRTAEEALSACLGRVKAIARAHELLAGDFTSLDLTEIIEALVAGVISGAEETLPKIEVSIQGSPLKLPPKQFVTLAFIINELLQNATKHAFIGRERGRIEVRTGEEGGRYILEVRDDGVGLPVEMKGGNGIGLEIVQTLCRADLDGDWVFFQDGGTVARISFPKPVFEAGGRR